MKKRIIIRESQFARLKANIVESSVYSTVIKRIKDELDANYEPANKFVRQGGEYSELPMIIIKTDNETISPKSLYQYLKYKYGVGNEFIKQIIRDWVSGKIGDDYQLSKNVTMD